MITVAIADDQTLVRQGIRSLLALLPDMEVLWEAGDGEEVLSRLTGAPPDVLLLDIRMPRMDGVGVLKSAQQWGRLPPTLVLTTFDDYNVAFDAIRAGAKGYLLKDVSLDVLAAAIRELANGGTVLHPNLTERLLSNARDRAEPQSSCGTLSSREKQVLRLIAGGYSNREIAEMLKLAEGTVKNHVSSLLEKIGARDRTQAVLKGLEGGWLR